MKWTTIWVDDWAAGVGPLSPEQRGVFFTMVCYFVSKDCVIPDDDHYLSRLCNMTVYAYRKVKKHLLVNDHIEIKNGKIWIERSAKQWEKDELYSKKQSNKAKKRHAIAKANILENNKTDSTMADAQADTAGDAFPTPTPTPTPLSKKINKKNKWVNGKGPILKLKDETYELAKDVFKDWPCDEFIYKLQTTWQGIDHPRNKKDRDKSFVKFCQVHAERNSL